ncbi:MAG TPA: transglutaminase-like domain-containing protein [Vicinamibacterales bacterium]|nr:transglutaminase-like domain-containing protein [Vicinamibacterales bacterium]
MVLRPIPLLVLAAWVATMGAIVKRAYVEAAPGALATDLGRYGSSAQWRGIYYRGDKVGFSVSQADAVDDGFELREEGRLQIALFGSITPARMRTVARVDRAFALRSFEFLLDPGTGPTEVRGALDGLRLTITVTTRGGTVSDVRELTEAPLLSLNLGRRLASAGLTPGATYRWALFDPATLRNAAVDIAVGTRELIRVPASSVREMVSIPAFRVDLNVSGLRTTSWVTDTGDVLREESPMGFITQRETAQAAQRMVASVRTDMIEGSAVVPEMKQRIDEPRDVRRLRLRLTGIDLSATEMNGVGQSVIGDVIEVRDVRTLGAGPADEDATKYLSPEPFIESDDPAIVREALAAVQQAPDARTRAERLVRRVNAMLEKKPTISLPSAREVLRTRVGDCNEHTALYVAMARAAGVPARIAVGLTFVKGAFYYHAWPEVYLDDGSSRGRWLPVDPTLNQFPADATHLRLARGALDKQAAIVPLIGRMKMEVLDVELAPGSTPVLAGRAPTDMAPLAIPLPERSVTGCWVDTPLLSPPPVRPRRR